MSGKAFFIMRLNDHVQYLQKIEATLHGKGDFQGSTHTECKLGKWIYGGGVEEIANLGSAAIKVFESIKQPHEDFHNISKRALEKQTSGDTEGAKAASTEMHVLSTVICNKLLELDKLG